MKTTKFLAMAFAALFLSAAFTACDKDENNDKPKEETVVPGNSDENDGSNSEENNENSGGSNENTETPDNNGSENTGNDNNGEESKGDESNGDSGENNNNPPALSEGTLVDGHYAVDLGLSVRWATINLDYYEEDYNKRGITLTPEKSGSYFAWGETRPKSDYSWNQYEYSIYDQKKDGELMMTKYCDDPKLGVADQKKVLEPEDDAACKIWKGKWRTPTSMELEELLKKCSWDIMELNGRIGFKVTGKNDNSIFLPAVGYYWRKQFCATTGDPVPAPFGCYWSSSRCTYPPSGGDNLFFAIRDNLSTSSKYMEEIGRYYGLPIRPVCPK